MRTWRILCLLIGVLALALAAWLPGSPDARSRALFWVGLVFAAAAIWRRGGG